MACQGVGHQPPLRQPTGKSLVFVRLLLLLLLSGARQQHPWQRQQQMAAAAVLWSRVVPWQVQALKGMWCCRWGLKLESDVVDLVCVWQGALGCRWDCLGFFGGEHPGSGGPGVEVGEVCLESYMCQEIGFTFCRCRCQLVWPLHCCNFVWKLAPNLFACLAGYLASV